MSPIAFGGISEKKEFASSRSKFFLLRVAPILEGSSEVNSRSHKNSLLLLKWQKYMAVILSP